MYLIFTLIISFSFYSKIECLFGDIVEIPLSVEDEVKAFGYGGLDKYKITTVDGYILELFRIKRKNPEKLRPVLLVHGVTACGDYFFMVQNDSAPIFLADNDYDVWIFNSRGTRSSMGHTTLNSTTDREYWYYSWQEIGQFDLPAAVDFVLRKNDHEKLILIGHSAGTTIITVMLSELPEYNDKVLLTVLWGVSIYHEHCAAFVYLAAICDLQPFLSALSDSLGVFRILPFRDLEEIFQVMCRLRTFRNVCIQFLESIMFKNELTKDVPNWSTFITRGLCGGSLRELYHFMQVGSSGRFAKYNYGTKKNLAIYNSSEPPLFRLSNVRSPVVLWCGYNDEFCSRNDLNRIAAELPNVASRTFFGEPVFAHTDFILARDLKKYMYTDLLILFEKYENLDKSKSDMKNIE